LNGREGQYDRGSCVVRQIHRHLDDVAALERDPDRFHVLESAAAVPDGRGNLLRDVEAIGRQIDVVGDQGIRAPTTDTPGGWMRHGRSEVGRPAFRSHLPCQTFELAAADVLQIPARRVRGRLFVEINKSESVRRWQRPPAVRAQRIPPS